jgi:hypothetical protein
MILICKQKISLGFKNIAYPFAPFAVNPTYKRKIKISLFLNQNFHFKIKTGLLEQKIPKTIESN